MTRLTADAIQELAFQALLACGATQANAEPVARATMRAEMDGIGPVGLGFLPEPSQSLSRMQHHDVIEEGIFKPRNNVVPVPEGPGLGVTPSRDELDYLHRHFMEHGPYNKYRDPDRPDLMRRLPLS